jgi:hypothetical protein
MLELLGDSALPVACSLVRDHWKEAPANLGPDIFNWIFKTVTVEAWNDTTNELAARGINLLWVSGNYDLICDLLKAGVDCTLSAKAWDGVKREGVWTGYVQPLTHVLGKYLKLVALLGTAKEKELKNLTKVQGASKIIKVLGGLRNSPKILLNYTSIQSCQMITTFAEEPGTIWGFEDVRLPYVQAARDTAHGQQPLRMLDMWEVISLVLDPAVFVKLISHPQETIRKYVEQGAEQVRKGIKEGGEQYDGMILDRYVPAFIQQCTSFLTFLSRRPPYAKFLDQPSETGKYPGKLLPSYACKTGIWWALSTNTPLYYCLDGLNMEDAIKYKAFKTKEINAYLTALDTPIKDLLTLRPFQDVITLAEVREILLNWNQVGKIVRFVEMGGILSPDETEQRVKGWQDKMQEIDIAAPLREWRGQLDLVDQAMGLREDELFWAGVKGSDLRDCVKESKILNLAATADAELLSQVLNEECPTLRAFALLPWVFADAFKAALDANDKTRPAALAYLREVLSLVCGGLRKPLGAAIDRFFGPAAQLPTGSDPVLDLDLDVDPSPGTGTPPTGPIPVPVPVSSTTQEVGEQESDTTGQKGDNRDKK